jgi:hypothetical protein
VVIQDWRGRQWRASVKTVVLCLLQVTGNSCRNFENKNKGRLCTLVLFASCYVFPISVARMCVQTRESPLPPPSKRPATLPVAVIGLSPYDFKYCVCYSLSRYFPPCLLMNFCLSFSVLVPLQPFISFASEVRAASRSALSVSCRSCLAPSHCILSLFPWYSTGEFQSTCHFC